MSTYEEFMVLLTFGILVVTILEYVNHKNSRPYSLGGDDGYFLVIQLRRGG